MRLTSFTGPGLVGVLLGMGMAAALPPLPGLPLFIVQDICYDINEPADPPYMGVCQGLRAIDCHSLLASRCETVVVSPGNPRDLERLLP